jgi:hypothetical protein
MGQPSFALLAEALSMKRDTTPRSAVFWDSGSPLQALTVSSAGLVTGRFG